MKKEKKSNPFFYTIKCKRTHRIGNLIQAFASLADAVITISTLGFVYTTLELRWSIFRINSKWYQSK